MFLKCNHSVFTVLQLHDIWKRGGSIPSMLTRVMCLYFTIPLTPPFLPYFLLSDHHFLHYSSPDLFSHLANWEKNGPVHIEDVCRQQIKSIVSSKMIIAIFDVGENTCKMGNHHSLLLPQCF